jgi:digeranylgeranylglycerophospholipid reductase
MDRVEIAIIGAGPAGSAAAREAALAGLNPLLIERDSSPGEKNACGGVAAAAFRKTLGLTDDVVERDIRRLVLSVDGAEHEIASRRPGYISFQRAVFDAFLAQRAVRAGAELLTATSVTRVQPASRRLTLRHIPTGSERELEADVLIFADGPRTLAAGAFGMGHRPGPATRHALLWELEGPPADGETMEVVVDTTARATGYAWVFPKRDRVQVGIGGPRGQGHEPLGARLARFVESRPALCGRAVLRRRGGLIPVERSRQLVADGAMVVGDAAGLVNSLTGGGIAFALLSGRIAGRAAAAAVKNGEASARRLRGYPRRLAATPQYVWLLAMGVLRRRLDRRPPDEQAAAHARMLKRYFRFLGCLRPLIDLLC